MVLKVTKYGFAQIPRSTERASAFELLRPNAGRQILALVRTCQPHYAGGLNLGQKRTRRFSDKPSGDFYLNRSVPL